MSRPVVAMSMPAPGDNVRITMSAYYHHAVRRAGGRSVMIPPGEEDVAGLLDIVDAVILTGGGDLDPSVTGGPDHPSIYGTNLERDEFELELARVAIERETPLLAICRGMQVVNVALGGTLHPHLPDVVGEDIAHRSDPPGAVHHEVELDAHSVVARAMTSTTVTTASWHHQGVNELGAGLRIVAEAPDGTVEAIELVGHVRLAATQWHPEITAAEDPSQQALFDSLVEWASA